ncbi:MAG TPA: 50S ribosomal protein L18e [archaeon]|nr:50S ribosomal protein L18e [archaeon]
MHGTAGMPRHTQGLKTTLAEQSVALRKRIQQRDFTDPRIKHLLVQLARTKSPFWIAVAKHLSTPSRNRVGINLSQINRQATAGDTLVVPGKVLGSGNLTSKVTVVAYQFSQSAVETIKKAGGEALLIEELVEKDKTGKKLKLVI